MSGESPIIDIQVSDGTDTYLSDFAIHAWINTLTNDSWETEVDSEWNEILKFYFNSQSSKSWVVSPHLRFPDQLSPDFVVTLMEGSIESPKKTEILVVEDKRPNEKTPNASIAENQMDVYCYKCCMKSGLRKMFGAVAKGFTVEFFEYIFTEEDKQATEWVDGKLEYVKNVKPLELDDPTGIKRGGVFHIKNDHIWIDYFLRVIREYPILPGA